MAAASLRTALLPLPAVGRTKTPVLMRNNKDRETLSEKESLRGLLFNFRHFL